MACLGSSTTAGLGASTPFPQVLAGLLGGSWQTDSYARSGDQTSGILSRWRSEVSGKGYRWLVVQGGTNDLRAVPPVPPDAAFENLRTIAAEATAQGARVILLTVTPYQGWPDWTLEADANRRALNGLILAACGQGVAACVDTAALFEDPGIPERLAAPYDSGDHLHVNQAGADLIAARVLSVIREAEGAQAEAASSVSGGPQRLAHRGPEDRAAALH